MDVDRLVRKTSVEDDLANVPVDLAYRRAAVACRIYGPQARPAEDTCGQPKEDGSTEVHRADQRRRQVDERAAIIKTNRSSGDVRLDRGAAKVALAPTQDTSLGVQRQKDC